MTAEQTISKARKVGHRKGTPVACVWSPLWAVVEPDLRAEFGDLDIERQPPGPDGAYRVLAYRVGEVQMPEAERRMGELLAETERAKGAAAGGKKESPRGHYTLPRESEKPTLAAIGVSKRESAEASQTATRPATPLPAAEPELHDRATHSISGSVGTATMARMNLNNCGLE